MSKWEVVGGADKGGILVREGEGLKSPQCADRLSTGAILEEVELKGERLHYKILEGTGPAEGWVSLKISGKELVVPKEEEIGGPGEPAAVPVDEELKAKIEAAAKEHEKAGDLLLFCPKYKVLGGPVEDCKFRIVAFHNAGSTESIYTGPGTTLFKWIKECKQVEILAVDYPGRDKIMKMPKHTTQDTLCPLLLAVLYNKLNDGIPYVVWGHSVGTWVAFEFLLLARKCGLPMPKAAFLNAFPAPHMPVSMRPWGRSKLMKTDGIKKELMDWDKGHFTGAGKVVYDEPGWTETWEPMMRADFQLYDEYKFKHTGAPPFDFPLHCWHMEGEYFNKANMIEMWGPWTTGKFDFKVMEEMGHLTCFYKPEYKKIYHGEVTKLIQEYSGI